MQSLRSVFATISPTPLNPQGLRLSLWQLLSSGCCANEEKINKNVGKFYVTGESLKRSASYHPFVIIRPSIRLLHAPTLRNTSTVTVVNISRESHVLPSPVPGYES